LGTDELAESHGLTSRGRQVRRPEGLGRNGSQAWSARHPEMPPWNDQVAGAAEPGRFSDWFCGPGLGPAAPKFAAAAMSRPPRRSPARLLGAHMRADQRGIWQMGQIPRVSFPRSSRGNAPGEKSPRGHIYAAIW